MKFQNRNLPQIDFLKVAGAQLILLHHLTVYGPMSDVAGEFAPALFEWLYEQARLAVPLFLVAGGFLAARSLAPRASLAIGQPLLLIWKRYCRLAAPLAAAIALAMACAAFARAAHPQASVPTAPGMLQVIAHLFLLQDLLDYEALSAGVWYVAIDFQLYVLMVALIWLSRLRGTAGHRRLAVTLVAGLALASLFYFNRIPSWDHWAVYFFGAYAMGALAFWASESRHPVRWLGFMTAVVTATLMIDFRSRIAVALFAAVFLGLTIPAKLRAHQAVAKTMAFLGDISYSVFLVHYPVHLVVNALFGRLAPTDPATNALGMLLAWSLSLVSGALFHRYVEKPAGLWVAQITPVGLAAQPNRLGCSPK